MLCIVINMNGCLLKIFVVTIVDIRKYLGIAIYQREPAVLDLHHDLMALFKGMRHIRNTERYVGWLVWNKGNRLFKAIPVLSTHDLPTYQHLVTAHRVGSRNKPAVFGSRIAVIFEILRKHIYHFYHKISICAAGAYKQLS